ncbi:MAG TPA: hypothetical protein ENK58_04655 [Desulfobacterales bacterium]|nr:hypothetical protein [Desulfobacterales bacterium]
MHIGHIRYFEQAKRMGDVLVVTITEDGYMDKGPLRPAFTEALRSEAIASLSCVDYVAVNPWPTAEETLRLLRPDFYVKGSEFNESYDVAISGIYVASQFDTITDKWFRWQRTGILQ